MSRTGWVLGAAVVVAAIAGGSYYEKNKTTGPKFNLQKVDRGDVIATVTAAGTLSAVTTVAVGSQVSGIIAKLYVDFNSHVKKGQLLAELDPTPFLEAVAQQRANLAKAKVDLRLGNLALARQKKLRDLQLIAQADLDTAEATRDDAAAAVQQNEALLQQAETNVAYTKIAAPIDGVVVDREYNVGQTVAASFQAPLIFSIAQDLTKMQVLTSIDEADVGGVNVGQDAKFTVDAYPDRTFRGKVAQIRLSTQTVQNVVTYPVMIDVPNLDGKLMPGMTANVQIPVAVRSNVLRVPNSALRFKPDPTDLAPGSQLPVRTASNGQQGAGGAAAQIASQPGGPGGPGKPGDANKMHAGTGGHEGVVYVPAPNGKLRPIAVHTLLTDGLYTAIEAKDLAPGQDIAVGLATFRAGDASGRPPAGGMRIRM